MDHCVYKYIEISLVWCVYQSNIVQSSRPMVVRGAFPQLHKCASFVCWTHHLWSSAAGAERCTFRFSRLKQPSVLIDSKQLDSTCDLNIFFESPNPGRMVVKPPLPLVNLFSMSTQATKLLLGVSPRTMSVAMADWNKYLKWKQANLS